MGRKRYPNCNRYQPRNEVSNSRNRGRARDDGGADGCSTDGHTDENESSRSVPSDVTKLDEIITITANGRDGKWPSLFTLDIMGIQFEAVLSTGSGGSVLSSRVYDLIEKKLSGDDRYTLQQIPGVKICDLWQQEIKQLGAVRIPCTIFSDCGRQSVTHDITFIVIEGGEIDGVVGASDFSGHLLDFIFQRGPKPSRFPRIVGKIPSTEDSPRSPDSKVIKVTSTIVRQIEWFKVEDEQNLAERCSSPERIVTIIPTTSEKHSLMMKMQIANVAFEGVLSIGSGGTVLSSRIYDRITLESKDTRRYRLEKPSSGIQICDITGNRLKLLGTLRVPCKFFSARGTNSVVEQITFLVVDGASVDCVFGKPEIYSCKMSIVLYRHLLVFNNHPSPIPIAMVGAEEDPDVAFKEEERKNLPVERPLSPVSIVTISLMTFTGKFPYMLKMDIVGVPFQVVLSTGSSGTVLSAEVYNRILCKTKDPRYQLQKATNVEVRDIKGNPMKLLGIVDVPCRFICARGKNSVIEIMKFLVVENLIADGVFGRPEIGSYNLSIHFEEGNSAVRFLNYKPPIEIAILERL